MAAPEDPARRIAELERQLAEARSQQARVEFSGQAADDLSAHRVDTRLAEAPRRIPPSFWLAELLPFRWWYVFAMFMVAVPPIALWISFPAAVAPAAVVTLFLIYGYQLWTARKRLALIQWAQVATVTGSEILSRGTYYSGTTYSNVFLPQAHGWTVTRQLWSGPSTKTKVGYALAGQRGELKLSGRSYEDGVILADQRNPAVALCVSSFAYDLDRDESGNWTGGLRTRLKVGMAVWTLIVVAWLAAGVGISTGIAKDVFATRLSQGGSGSVDGDSTVYCNDGHLTTDGIDYAVTVHGHCASLHVSGINGVVTIDSVDDVTVSGIDNRVVYHSGTPRLSKNSMGGSVSRG